MKNLKIGITILFIGLTTLAQAQERQSKEKIEAIKIAYLTEKISLTESQSKAFWPLYNKYAEEKALLRSGKSEKESKKLEDMSDAEINALLEQRFKNEEQMLQLQKKYFEKYKTVISLKQIALLYKAERDFRKEMLERIRSKK